MNHIDLFSGIGGFALAAKWTGFETVVFCEKDEFCQKVLQKRFGGYVADSADCRCEHGQIHDGGSKATTEKREVPNEPCVTDKCGGIPIIPEIRDFDGTKWRGTTLLTGGFPCQPFSVAGKQKGKEDDRYLWPEMLRVIKEAKPRWILAENVAGIFKMALDTVLADLEGEGYTTGTVVIPAAGINAPHRRDRIWIIGYSEYIRQPKSEIRKGIMEGSHTGQEKQSPTRKFEGSTQQSGCMGQLSEKGLQDAPDPGGKKRNRLSGFGGEKISEIGGTNQDASDSLNNGHSKRHEEAGRKIGKGKQGRMCEFEGTNSWEIPWLEVATRFCRVDDGAPNRVDRLKSLGNAIVPQIAAEIMKGIVEMEKGILS